MRYNIEIGQKTNNRMSYQDALVYVFCLGDGWRLPTLVEYSHDMINYSWWLNDDRVNGPELWYVTPVRDLT